MTYISPARPTNAAHTAATNRLPSEMRSYIPWIPNMRRYTTNPAMRSATNTDARLNLYWTNTATDPVPTPIATDMARTGRNTSVSNEPFHIARIVAAVNAATSWQKAVLSRIIMNLESTR
jgi:hypothetical protein